MESRRSRDLPLVAQADRLYRASRRDCRIATAEMLSGRAGIARRHGGVRVEAGALLNTCIAQPSALVNHIWELHHETYYRSSGAPRDRNPRDRALLCPYQGRPGRRARRVRQLHPDVPRHAEHASPQRRLLRDRQPRRERPDDDLEVRRHPAGREPPGHHPRHAQHQRLRDAVEPLPALERSVTRAGKPISPHSRTTTAVTPANRPGIAPTNAPYTATAAVFTQPTA